MITTGFERGFKRAKDRLAVMQNFRGLAVDNRSRAHDAAAKSLADRLVAQTNAEDRNAAGETRDQREGYSGVGRATRPGRDQDATRKTLLDLTECYFVVSPHDDVLAKLTQILDQVVSKRIVVVDDQNHFFV